MAKVYSWEVAKSPKKYAYIVNPKDLTNAYVGTELKGNYLEIVKDWAANCSDEEYEAQFQKMLELCAKKGYNVEFETASAYMNVTSTCDNLRGPAGRGIDHITLQSTDKVTKISKYIIYYDDDTTDTFEIQNGKDGIDGTNGLAGAPGDAGISSKLVMIYTSGMDEYGNTFTPSRPQPTDGRYNFAQNKFENCPNGWFTSDTDVNGEQLTPPIWMSSRVFASSTDSTDKEWALPIQITGDTGAPGADGVTTEFIYYLDDAEPMVDNLPSLNEAGYVPPAETGWTSSPTGVDEDHLTEWCSLRKINRETKEWGPWEKPFIWSKYGVNGQDGDGVQYMYLKNAGAILENPTPLDYLTNADYQNKNIEWIPENKVSYINIDNKLVSYDAIEEVEGDAIPAGVWTDNPSDLTSTYHSQWVSSRKYRKNPDTGKMEWGAFSAPALWARYGQDGKNATSVRKLYALSTSTSDAPTLPSDSTTTGDWGTGFPLDYQVGVNVVWGTEAEIWAHNSEFVMTYKIASGRNADGEVIAPSDITETNFKDVESIPNDKVEGYDYLRFNGDYYKWSGGWCQPYLVTGLKGESGYAPNYIIYVFAYAYTDHVPGAPTGKSPTLPGVSLDELGNTIYWSDFPDTTNGRIDGAIDPITGKKQRWYQCIGHVYGHNNEVYEWGTVTPCSGQDGIQGTNGNYTEIRFGVTKDATKPSLIQSNNGVIYREPELYDANGTRMGWFATDEDLPDIPAGGAMWQIWATINGADDSVMEVGGKYWNGPKRISGEQGEQGIQGPAGMRGASGIPGRTFIQMYCLGTYGKNKNSECYWETGGIDGGDGYFGSTNWKNNVLQNQMDGWFIGKEMPYSDPLTAYNENELMDLAKQPANKGRVVKLTETIFTQTTYTYWLINSDSTYTQLTQTLTSDEDFDVYVWCIQGNEKWEAGGDEVEYKLVGIEWGSPFKLQGTNGLRGLQGNRGQVVYPMGVYNQEEVYVTTADKAPYVYDSSDGMYYVYNNTEIPWVGVLPGYDPETKEQGDLYKTIMVHPNDASSNSKPVTEDPTKKHEEDTECKYLYYDNKYYIWNGSGYSMASRYKYSIDGSGAENTWMTSQHGDSPANNYANATNSLNKPAWERFESFKALYTSIGIIENGMIGSAVYNNEFMFSQQGYKQDGVTPTNYAVVSGTITEYGFLSGYEYDEYGERDSDGVPTGRHWKYRGTSDYINNTDINPYEKNSEGEYIHAFLPNVCINFSTGQMWLSTGQIKFGGNYRNIFTDEEVNKNVKDATDALNTELTTYIQSNDLFLAQIGSRLTDAETGITEINKSGFVAEDDFAEMFSTKVLKDEDGNVTKELKSFIKTEAENITISSEDIFINGNTYINDQFKIDIDGNLTVQNAAIENCDVTNVTVQGSMRSPFVLDDNVEKISLDKFDYSDNIAFLTSLENDNDAVVYSENIKWDPDQSGRKITLVNAKWKNDDNFDTLATGFVQLDAPSIDVSDLEEKFTGMASANENIFSYSQTTKGYPNTFTKSRGGSIKINGYQGLKNFNCRVKCKYCILSIYLCRNWNDKSQVFSITHKDPNDTDDRWHEVSIPQSVLVANLKGSSNPEIQIVMEFLEDFKAKDYTCSASIALPNYYSNMGFFENGRLYKSISFSREALELIGYGTPDTFYGWIVTNRNDVLTNSYYGKEVKALAWGEIHMKDGTLDNEKSRAATYDNTPLTLDYESPGKWKFNFQEQWDSRLDKCFMMVSPLDSISHPLAKYDKDTSTFTVELRIAAHAEQYQGGSNSTNNIIEYVSYPHVDGSFAFVLVNIYTLISNSGIIPTIEA